MKDPSEQAQLEAIKINEFNIRYINNPTKKVQLEAIEKSRYDIAIIALCPDWKEFEQEILDNMMIKDIIE